MPLEGIVGSTAAQPSRFQGVSARIQNNALATAGDEGDRRSGSIEVKIEGYLLGTHTLPHKEGLCERMEEIVETALPELSSADRGTLAVQLSNYVVSRASSADVDAIASYGLDKQYKASKESIDIDFSCRGVVRLTKRTEYVSNGADGQTSEAVAHSLKTAFCVAFPVQPKSCIEANPRYRGCAWSCADKKVTESLKTFGDTLLQFLDRFLKYFDYSLLRRETPAESAELQEMLEIDSKDGDRSSGMHQSGRVRTLSASEIVSVPADAKKLRDEAHTRSTEYEKTEEALHRFRVGLQRYVAEGVAKGVGRLSYGTARDILRMIDSFGRTSPIKARVEIVKYVEELEGCKRLEREPDMSAEDPLEKLVREFESECEAAQMERWKDPAFALEGLMKCIPGDASAEERRTFDAFKKLFEGDDGAVGARAQKHDSALAFALEAVNKSGSFMKPILAQYIRAYEVLELHNFANASEVLVARNRVIAVEAECASLTSAIVDVRRENNALKLSLAFSERRAEGLEKTVQARDVELEAAKQEVVLGKREAEEKFQSELKESKNEYESKISDLQETIRALDVKLERFAGEVDVLSGEAKQLRQSSNQADAKRTEVENSAKISAERYQEDLRTLQFEHARALDGAYANFKEEIAAVRASVDVKVSGIGEFSQGDMARIEGRIGGLASSARVNGVFDRFSICGTLLMIMSEIKTEEQGEALFAYLTNASNQVSIDLKFLLNGIGPSLLKAIGNNEPREGISRVQAVSLGPLMDAFQITGKKEGRWFSAASVMAVNVSDELMKYVNSVRSGKDQGDWESKAVGEALVTPGCKRWAARCSARTSQ